MAESHKPVRDPYRDLTDKLVALLESGKPPPWRKPWSSEFAPTGPVNIDGRPYRGINVIALGMSPLAFESGDPRWCTYRAAKLAGAQVRGGEKASTVYFFKRLDRDDDESGNGDEPQRQTIVIRSYPVFNASQIDGLEPFRAPTSEQAKWRAPEAAEIILGNSGVPIREGGDRAFYSPGTDHIQLPPRAAFDTAEGWTATALHELAHSTGHPGRLNRDLKNRFGSAAYAQEELRAELASVMTCAMIGVRADLKQHASYIDSWIQVLKSDKREIFRAAGDAQKAADLCLSYHPDYAARLAAERLGDNQAPGDAIGGLTSSPPEAPTLPAIPTGIAAFGPMPKHIQRRLNPEPVIADIPAAVTPTMEEAASWSYRPR